MNANQVVAAYQAVQELSAIVLPYKAARGVASLKKRLGEEFETVRATERALLEQYNGRVKKNGQYDFPDEEAAEGFLAEFEAFREQEDDIRLPKVDLSQYASLIRVSGGAVEALEGLVAFEREQEEDDG